MIKSMTGYGRAEAVAEGRSVSVEIRSVNHRYSEVSVRLHGRCSFAEDAVRQLVKSRAGRGKIDVSIYFTSTNEEDALVTLNNAVAKQYFTGLRDLQKAFDTTGEISLELLASMPEVFKQDRPQASEDAILALLLESTEKALASFDEMRGSEGLKLKEDFEKRLDSIENHVKSIGDRAPEVLELHTAKIKERIASLVENSIDDAVFEQRLAMEIAVFADKASLEEELVRLTSHLEQFRKAINGTGGEPVGKKLDFIVQEMNREANTIGSKANDLHITEQMIELKNGIENIREQVQNIV